MPFVSSRQIEKNVEKTGSTVTITEVTRSVGSDEYRETTETTSDTTGVKCQVQVLSESDDQVREGNFRAGDLRFIFPTDRESIIKKGNRITWNSKTYEIVDVHIFETSGNTRVIEATTSQV